MGDKLDRRGFLRLGRRAEDETGEEVAEEEAEREPTPQELKIQELADFSERLLADYASEDEEPVAHGPLLTKAYDLAYMRVTTGHIVYTTVLGVSIAVKTGDVVAFDTDPPEEASTYGVQIIGVIRAHHPLDPPHVTRSYSFRFPDGSLLIPAIRNVCNLPEPEPETASEAEAAALAEEGAGSETPEGQDA
jgi:hypothetical protein